MHRTHIEDVQGTRFGAPYEREIKHLHTPWGTGAESLWVGMSVVPAGSESNPHIHDAQEESFFVHEGVGEVVVDGTPVPVRPGSLVVVAAGELHQLRNTGEVPLRVLCAVAPPFSADQFADVHDPNS
ncbi:cupin domain-containing protein [Leucobacter celer]|jgi:mannose-6-phosphate isomerase-like protein (cupin superfamily)|uniref:cupin domain-containing protein n=1 Tax=Leucobacter celer TaxID=668625 RepID=UPI0006A7DF34|nr:cupin domain-containing protein [Leucobacter celer]